MAGAYRRDLLRGTGHLPPHPADRRDQLGDGVLGRHRIRQHRGVDRPAPAAFQDPGLLNHLLDRTADAVRALGSRQPPPPVHQGRRVEPAMIEREPARRLPPQITAGRLGRLGVGVIMQHLQHHHRGHHARRDRRPPPPRREQVREVLIGEQLAPVGRQEREHTPSRHQVPHQRLRVQQLPIRPLSALHAEIIPDDRTHCRQHAYQERPLFSGLPERLRLGPPSSVVMAARN